MAGLVESVPDNLLINMRYSEGLNSGVTTPNIKYKPTNPDGSLIDLTGYNSANLYVFQNMTSGPAEQVSAMNITSADNTGIVLNLVAASVTNFANAYPPGNYPASIIVSNGSGDVVVAAQGSISLLQQA